MPPCDCECSNQPYLPVQLGLKLLEHSESLGETVSCLAPAQRRREPALHLRLGHQLLQRRRCDSSTTLFWDFGGQEGHMRPASQPR